MILSSSEIMSAFVFLQISTMNFRDLKLHNLVCFSVLLLCYLAKHVAGSLVFDSSTRAYFTYDSVGSILNFFFSFCSRKQPRAFFFFSFTVLCKKKMASNNLKRKIALYAPYDGCDCYVHVVKFVKLFF